MVSPSDVDSSPAFGGSHSVVVRRSLEPDGGEGLFATAPRRGGEVLVEERPLARLKADAFQKQNVGLLVEAHDQLLLSGELDALLASDAGKGLWRGPEDDYRRDAFIRCVEETWPEGSVEARARRVEAMRVFSYNAYATRDGAPVHTVFPTISKANHRCDPNCWVVIPESCDGGQLVCARQLAEGDEVTVSYLCKADLMRPLPKRRALLRDGWEFVCCCSRCSSSADDARRFSCPQPGCAGTCAISSECGGEADVAQAAPCSCCGWLPGEHLDEWLAREMELEALIDALPASLYSAWAPCEDFAQDHPLHGLSGRWKNFISRWTEAEAEQVEDEVEREELLKEAARHREACLRCLRELLHEDFSSS